MVRAYNIRHRDCTYFFLFIILTIDRVLFYPIPKHSKSENVEDSKHSAELLKMQHLNSGMSNTKSLKKSHSDTQKVQKSVSKPLGKQWYSDSKLPPRTRRDTIELKSPVTVSRHFPLRPLPDARYYSDHARSHSCCVRAQARRRRAV